MELNCKHVWGYISDYLDGSVDAGLREQIERHLEHCEICSAILDSTRNILYLTADDRTFALPVGYSERLHARLEQELAAMGGPDARLRRLEDVMEDDDEGLPRQRARQGSPQRGVSGDFQNGALAADTGFIRHCEAGRWRRRRIRQIA